MDQHNQRLRSLLASIDPKRFGPPEGIPNVNHIPFTALWRPGQGLFDPRIGSASASRTQEEPVPRTPTHPSHKVDVLRTADAEENKRDDQFHKNIDNPQYLEYENEGNYYPEKRTEEEETKEAKTEKNLEMEEVRREIRSQLEELRREENEKKIKEREAEARLDLRDYRGNNASWAGYEDRRVTGGQLLRDRVDHLYTPRREPFTGTDWNQDYKPRREYYPFPEEKPGASTDRGDYRSQYQDGTVSDPRFSVRAQYKGPELTKYSGGALLFIRFPTRRGENLAVAAHAFLKSKPRSMEGQFLGIAPKIYDFGYDAEAHSGGPGEEAIAVYYFRSTEKALLFFQYDHIIRQPDFPPPNGHAHMWIVPCVYLPTNMDNYTTFLLSEVKLHKGNPLTDFETFFERPFEDYLYEKGGMPFAIRSFDESKRMSIRGNAYSPQTLVICHLFKGLQHFRDVTSEEMYANFRNIHNQLASEKCSVFNIERDPCP